MPTSTFTVLASTDWGHVATNTSSVYPPDLSSGNISTNVMNVYKSLNGGLYYIYTGLIRFDTSSLPDDATIISANLIFTPTNGGSNDYRYLNIEYYNFTSIQVSQNVEIVNTNAYTGYLLTLLADFNPKTLNLSNTGNINKTGYTGFRLGISGGKPDGLNQIGLKDFSLQVIYTLGWGGKIYGIKPAKIYGIAPKKVMGL